MSMYTGYSIKEFHYLPNLPLSMFSKSLFVSGWGLKQASAKPGVMLRLQGLHLE